MISKLDELLAQLGTGWWHFLHYFAMGYGIALPVCHAMAGPFIAPKIDYVCIPPITGSSGTFMDDDHQSGNTTTDSKSSSDLYVNITQRNQCIYKVANNITGDLEEWPCKEWSFDNSIFTSTITSEFELTCDRNYLRATYQSIFMAGVFVGALLSAFLADKYGRKGMVVFGIITFTGLTVASSWITNLSALLLSRFLMGVIMPFMSNVCYIMVVEISEARFRPHLGILAALPWAVTVMIWSGFAYLIRNWRWLQFVVSIPGVLVIPLLWFTDESPRWLAVTGQHDRALKVLKKAARWNGAVLPADNETLDILKESQDKEKSVNGKPRNRKMKAVIIEIVKDAAILFRSPKLRKITSILYIDYLIVNFVYYGLSLNGGNLLSNDPFLFMVLSGLMEMPAYSLPVPIVSRFGRRVPGVISFLLSGITLLTIALLPQGYRWLIMILAMFGKVTISTAYQILIFYSSELFPTEVRSRGIGTCFMISRIGSIVSPFITEILGAAFPWAPSLVFGVTSVIASVAMLTLPETLGVALPDTITHLELRKDRVRKWWFFRLKDPS